MSTYANAIISAKLSHARFAANLARKYPGGHGSTDFVRGLLIGAIHVAKYIEGADKDAALAAEHETSFLLGNYLRKERP